MNTAPLNGDLRLASTYILPFTPQTGGTARIGLVALGGKKVRVLKTEDL